MASGDEHYVGTPDVSRETSAFNIQMPAWGEVLDVIEEEDLTRCDFVIIGAIYCNSDEIGGTTLHLEDTEELYRVARKYDPDDSSDTPYIVQDLLDLECVPPRIVGFVIREM